LINNKSPLLHLVGRDNINNKSPLLHLVGLTLIYLSMMHGHSNIKNHIMLHIGHQWVGKQRT